MKKLIALILIAFMLIALVSCARPIEEAPILNDRFEYIGYGGTVNGNGVCYYRDTVTDVVYVRIYYGMSVLVKEDGTPYLWSELREEGK